MKQRINVAVEILNSTMSRRESYVNLLLGYALDNSFVKSNINMLGESRLAKKFFRFKYVEDTELNEDVTRAGFYYWTANNFKDTDVEVLTLEEFTKMIDKINPLDYKSRLQIAGRPVEIDSQHVAVGCKQFGRQTIERFLHELLGTDANLLRINFADGNFAELNRDILKTLYKELQGKGR